MKKQMTRDEPQENGSSTMGLTLSLRPTAYPAPAFTAVPEALLTTDYSYHSQGEVKLH